MRARLLFPLIVGVFAYILAAFLSPQYGDAQGGGPLTPLPNVTWSIKDSVTACPAGDTVLAGRPSRLRITVNYVEAAGVPPESIWVTYSTASGTARINDKSTKIYADDSTNAGGNTRITIPSLSGYGVLNLSLYVSGASEGTKTAVGSGYSGP